MADATMALTCAGEGLKALSNMIDAHERVNDKLASDEERLEAAQLAERYRGQAERAFLAATEAVGNDE